MPYKDKSGRICGFLDVDEQDKRKKFQRRYFILDKSKGHLEWFMDSPSNLDGAPQPCGSINIDYITKVDEAKRMRMDFLFVINTPFRPYYVQASNQKEVEEWVEILNDASKIIVPPEAMHPQPSPLDVPEFEELKENVGDDSTESNESSYTYRTEIVGNVVVKKKISEIKKPSIDESSPPFDSVGSDYKFSFPLNYSDEDVLKKGWGVKQGHLRKNWKRRYFVLTKAGFSYFKSEHDREPLRVVSMSDILAAKTENGDSSRVRDNLFLVVTTDKIYYIQADSPGDMLGWINAFNAAVKTYRLSTKKKQVMRRGASGLGGSTDVLDESRPTAKPQTEAKYLEKRSSAHSIFFTSTSMENAGNSAGSVGSLEKIPINEPAPKNHGQTKLTKTHRRAESAVTVLPTFTMETASSSIKSSRPSHGMLALHAEDVRARPESVNLSSLMEGVPEGGKRHGAPYSSRPVSGNYVACHLDPQIDLRSAVKPSTVKKKKNPGILFSLNTMLSRKQDKIQKEKWKFGNN